MLYKVGGGIVLLETLAASSLDQARIQGGRVEVITSSKPRNSIFFVSNYIF
jgi:hypothetical protein